MADPCPSCDSPLSLGGTFCKECGYDLDLAVADFEGEGAELPDGEMDDAAYRRTLAREGLSGPREARGLPASVVGVAVAVGLVVLWMLLGAQ
jgi:hypothetical protein